MTLGPGASTRAQAMADEIAEAILDGSLAPGTRLDEHKLAAHFGVSRTPVRDAIRLLQGTGLIDTQPYKSALVRRLSAEEIAGLFTAMGEIEASCARQCAAMMTGNERRELEALHARMGNAAESGERAAYVEGNRIFHALIDVGAHNAVLSEMASSLRRRLTPYRTAQFLLKGRLTSSHIEHGRVVRAVLARDAAAANEAMLAHLSVVEESFEIQDASRANDRSGRRELSTRKIEVVHGVELTDSLQGKR